MLSREEKIAVARKKLKKFQQRGGAKGSKSALSSSAPNREALLQATKAAGGFQNASLPPNDASVWRLGDVSASEESVPGASVLTNGSSEEPVAVSPLITNGGTDAVASHVPSTPSRPVAESFKPPSTSTPHRAALRPDTSHLQQQAQAQQVQDGVSPTHFGFKQGAGGVRVSAAAGVAATSSGQLPGAAVTSSGSTTATNGPLNVTSSASQASSRHATAPPPAHAGQPQMPPTATYQDTIDIENLKKQITAHQQTIDILVEEKNSLQSACNKYDSLVRERDNAILNYTLQLRSATEHSDGLRSQLAQQQAVIQSQASRHGNADVEAMSTELQRTRQYVQESQHQVAELSRKVQARATECVQLRQERDSLAEKLRTQGTLLEQMSSGDDSLEELRRYKQATVDEKARLERQLSDLSASLQRTLEERDLAVVQCRQAMEQTNNMKQHLDQERTGLAQQQAQMRQHFEQQATQITELNQQLTRLQQTGEAASVEKVHNMQQALQTLALEKQSLNEQLSSQCSQTEDLRRLSSEQAGRIQQLEDHISQQPSSGDERQQLLASMQADKQAISQATLANRDLKQRIEEMEALQSKAAQERSALETRLSGNNDETNVLEERLQEKTNLLRQIQEELAKSKQEIESLHSENDDLSDQLAKHVQIANRRQHLEAQSQLSDALQQELTSAQAAIQRLQTEKDQLRQTVMQQQALLSSVEADDDVVGGTGTDTHHSNHVPATRESSNESIPDAVAQRIKSLEGERSHLVSQLQEQSRRYQQELATLQEEMSRQRQMHPVEQDSGETWEVLHHSDSGTGSLEQSDVVPRQEYDSMQKTLEEVQERFLNIMTEKAELMQKVHSLEHQTGQLEGETNTIGEYIALYQLQRDTLRKRYEKKDEYIEQLTEEQQRMEAKVEELHGLVVDLVADRKSLVNRLMEFQSAGSGYHSQLDTMPSSPEMSMSAAQSNPLLDVPHAPHAVPHVPGVFEGDDSEMFDAHLSQVGSLPNFSELTFEDESAASLPAIVAANTEIRAEKIMSLLNDLKPVSHNRPPSLSEDFTDRPNAPRIGVDMEFLPCSHCEGRLLRV